MNRSLKLLPVFAIATVVSACGGGSGGSSNSAFPMTAPEEQQPLFPIDTELIWTGVGIANETAFEPSITIGGRNVWPLRQPDGSVEYFSTDDQGLYLFGLYTDEVDIPIAGIFSIDLRFEQGALIYTWDDLPGATSIHFPVVSIDSSPDFNPQQQPFNVSSLVIGQYIGMERIVTSLGAFEAHHIQYQYMTSATVDRNPATLADAREDLWLANDIGIVKRVSKDGTTWEVAGFNGPDRDFDGVPDAADEFPDDPTRFLNQPPEVVIASPPVDEVIGGNAITVSADATDPEDDVLSYLWSSPDDAIVLSNVDQADVDAEFTVDSLGTTQTLTVEVTDAVGNTTISSIDLTVPELLERFDDRQFIFDGISPDLQTIRVPVFWVGDDLMITALDSPPAITAEVGGDSEGNIWIDVTVDCNLFPVAGSGTISIAARYPISSKDFAEAPAFFEVVNTK